MNLTHRSRRLIIQRYLHSTYIIKPCTRLQEQEKQSLFLTNTILCDNPILTERNDKSLPVAERDNLVAAIKKNVVDVNYFHRDEELKLKKKTRDRTRARLLLKYKAEFSLQILLSMMKEVWTTKSARNAGFLDKTINYRADLVAPWERLSEKIQISGKHGHLISGKTPLPLFADETEVESTRTQALVWDDIISPFFDLHPLPTAFEPNSGFHPNAPYPFPQTLLITNPYNWKARMNSGQGIFYCFAHAVNHALNQGAKLGDDLKKPVAMQSIIFNGTSLFFTRYQLNTLNFNEDVNGLKNIAWIVNEEKLYDEVTDKLSESSDSINYVSKRVSLIDFDRKVLSDTFENARTRTLTIQGFNRNAVDLFLDFLFYPYAADSL